MRKLNIFAIIAAPLLALLLSSCGTSHSRTDSNRLAKAELTEKIETRVTYRNLTILDLDQMMDLVNQKLSDYKKNNNVQALKEAAGIVLSRPDSDAVVSKIISFVRNPLEDENQWESTITTLVKQSIETMKDKNANPAEQVTSGIILENLLADFKPVYKRQYKTGGFETDVVEYIASSESVYSKKANGERSLTIMKANSSPSRIAEALVKEKEKTLKDEEKQNK